MCSKIKELRDRTGAGMMECKNALQATSDDLEAAVKYLRERGLASLNKRAGNATNQGNFGLYDGSDSLCIVELLCETDFVGNSEVFKSAANELAAHLAATGADIEGKSLQEIAPQSVLDSLMTLKENIAVAHCACFKKSDGPVYNYIHNAGQNKVAAIVQLSQAHDDGRSVAVHVACSSPAPVAAKPVDVSQEAIDEEIRFSGASDEAKLRNQLSILGSPFLKDPSMTVAKVLGDTEVVRFVRFKIGG